MSKIDGGNEAVVDEGVVVGGEVNIDGLEVRVEDVEGEDFGVVVVVDLIWQRFKRRGIKEKD